MKLVTFKFIQRFQTMFLVSGALVLSASHALVEGQPGPFSRVVVFGDSLSDTGNFFALTGGLVPPPPYADGKFSNGPLWIEYLAESLGIQIQPGDNYAVAGATTGYFNSNDGLFGLEYPGLQDEVTSFLTAVGPAGADPDALYVVWAGANDFFVVLAAGLDPKVLFRESIPNLIGAIQLLREAGARHILVPNLPDLGITPYGQAFNNGREITQLSAQYNHLLAAALHRLAAQGICTIPVDAFAALQAMVYSPAEFGFSNVSVPLLTILATGGQANPAEFVFWDPVHPTTRAHEVLGDRARTMIDDYLEQEKLAGYCNPH